MNTVTAGAAQVSRIEEQYDANFDAGALLMPAHFGARFVCHIDRKGDGFVPRWA